MPTPAPASDGGANDRAILAWMGAALEEGEAFLKSQKGYSKFQETIDGIMGETSSLDPGAQLSSFDANHFGKVALDMTAALTDIKPFWEYKTFNTKFHQQAGMLGKLSQSWFTNRAIDLKFSNVVKYGVAMGTGYSHLFWNPETQDQDLMAEDPRDVIPIRPGDLFSIQDAQGVIIRRERTVNYVKSRYGAKAANVRADRDGSYVLQQAQSRASVASSLGLTSGFLSNLFKSNEKPHTGLGNIPVVDLFTCYVKDESVHEGSEPRMMGDPNANWSYWVKPGEKLYPRKRCIVFTRTAILYDGPNIYWHGLFPVCKLTLDPWPWSWLGKSPMKDLLPLKKELAELLRDVAAHNRRVRRPGVVADKNSVSRATMEKIDTTRPGLKLRYNPVTGKGVEIIQEPPLDQSIPSTIDWIIKQMKELSGVQDMTALNGLNQIPSAETVEKMMESMSLSVRLRSRVMETFLREFAMMVASNFFQFYTLPQRIAVLGASGMTFDDFDFDPGTLIPDMLDMGMMDEKGNPLPRQERAQAFLRYFTYHIAPGSLLAASEVTRKLMYLQLYRAGMIDMWTLGEVLGIPNLGEPPAATIPERLVLQQQMGIGATVSAAGRKASGQQMPSMKNDGRISESG